MTFYSFWATQFNSLSPAVFNSLIICALILTLLLSFTWGTCRSPLIYEFPYESLNYEPAENKKKTVMLAGSFNPPHNGHLNMLKTLSKIYGNVYAVVGFNPSKKYDVSPQKRLEIMQKKPGLILCMDVMNFAPIA